MADEMPRQAGWEKSTAADLGRAAAGGTEAARATRKTRAGEANAERILDAALEVFATHGLQGARIDQIAKVAGLSKPNLLYYFRTKDELYGAVLRRTLDMWLEPLRLLDADSDPREALSAYIGRKLAYSRSHPVASRLFAMEMLQGAPHLDVALKTALSELVEAKARTIEGWVRAGRLKPVDPKHLIFAIWATTQHYADFSTQIRALTGTGIEDAGYYAAAQDALARILLDGILPPDTGGK